MSPRRSKPEKNWQHHFNLNPDKPAHARLHDRLLELAFEGKASEWIIDTLLAAIAEPQPAGVQTRTIAVRPAPFASSTRPTPKTKSAGKSGTSYEPIDE